MTYLKDSISYHIVRLCSGQNFQANQDTPIKANILLVLEITSPVAEGRVSKRPLLE